VTTPTGTRDPYAWIATIAVLDRPTEDPLGPRVLSSEPGPIAWSIGERPLALHAMPPRDGDPRGHEGARPCGIVTSCARIGRHLVAEGTISALDLMEINPRLLERFMERKPLACGIDLRDVDSKAVRGNTFEFTSWRLAALTLHDDDEDVSWPELVFVRNDLEAWKTLTEHMKGRTK
jgi:hypothetical protein